MCACVTVCGRSGGPRRNATRRDATRDALNVGVRTSLAFNSLPVDCAVQQSLWQSICGRARARARAQNDSNLICTSLLGQTTFFQKSLNLSAASQQHFLDAHCQITRGAAQIHGRRTGYIKAVCGNRRAQRLAHAGHQTCSQYRTGKASYGPIGVGFFQPTRRPTRPRMRDRRGAPHQSSSFLLFHTARSRLAAGNTGAQIDSRLASDAFRAGPKRPAGSATSCTGRLPRFYCSLEANRSDAPCIHRPPSATSRHQPAQLVGASFYG